MWITMIRRNLRRIVARDSYRRTNEKRPPRGDGRSRDGGPKGIRPNLRFGAVLRLFGFGQQGIKIWRFVFVGLDDETARLLLRRRFVFRFGDVSDDTDDDFRVQCNPNRMQT